MIKKNYTIMKRKIITSLLLLLALSIQAQKEITIEGNVTNVDNGDVVSLYRWDGRVGSAIVSDTIKNGKFFFKVEAIKELEKLSLMGFPPKFPSAGRDLYVTPGCHISIQGDGYKILGWEVQSNVKEQQEHDFYMNVAREESDVLQDWLIQRETYDIILNSETATKEEKEIAREKFNDTSILNEYEFKSDGKKIDAMKNRPVTDIWLANLERFSSNANYYSEYPHREKVLELYNRLSKEQKDSEIGKSITAKLFPPVVVKIGDEMFDTDLYDLEGNLHHLAELKGRYILLDFWSSGCGPCIMAIPEMGEIAEKYKDKLAIVSLSSDTEKRWKEASEKHKLTWYNWSDKKQTIGLYLKYGVRGIPHYVLISPEGKIADTWGGYGKGSLYRHLSKYLEPKKASITGSVNELRKSLEQYDYETVIGSVPPVAGDSTLTPLRAQALKAMGRLSETLAEWNSLLPSDSTNTKVVIELAECYRQMGNARKAVECYRKAMEMQPLNKYFRLQCIRTLLNAEEYEEAKAVCHEWLDMDTTSATGYKYLGQVYEGLTEKDEQALSYAFISYNAAYRRDSLDAQTVARIANIFNNNQQYKDAIDVTETYRLTDTLNMDVNRQNAKAYCLNKEYKKAIERYESLKRLGDRSFLTFYYLGVSYVHDYWPYGAYDNLKEAHRLSPQDINVLYYLARACAHSSYKQEGVMYMMDAIDIATSEDSLMARLYDGLAECYYYAGEPYKQIDALKELYKWNKRRVNFYRIAEIYEGRKDYANAIHYYEKYMALVPEDERVPRDEEGNPIEGSQTFYQLADKRIKELKEEDFFQNGVNK